MSHGHHNNHQHLLKKVFVLMSAVVSTVVVQKHTTTKFKAWSFPGYCGGRLLLSNLTHLANNTPSITTSLICGDIYNYSRFIVWQFQYPKFTWHRFTSLVQQGVNSLSAVTWKAVTLDMIASSIISIPHTGLLAICSAWQVSAVNLCCDKITTMMTQLLIISWYDKIFHISIQWIDPFLRLLLGIPGRVG